MLIGYLAVWGGYCTAIWVHSSMAEHLTVNQGVGGSSPSVPAIKWSIGPMC